jgi:hypothetical protein
VTRRRPAAAIAAETLERRRLFAVVRPDHVVVVIEQDRASDAIGNVNFPYLNSLASTGLYYTSAHGVSHPSEPNTAAIYSGSTQGVTDNARTHSFAGANLARSLFDAGLSFTGYSENLPADGSQVTQAGDSQYPDLYTRNLNPMAQFTDVGMLPTGQPRPNSAVNRTFNAFKAISTTDYSSLPTVSYIVPNNLHSTHGSNEAYPWAGSADEQNNDVLRRAADAWLRDNIDPYLQWARTHNSLLVVTQDEERWTGGTAQTVTTLVNGDPDLFVAGTNSSSVNHYNLLRTIEDMYGLARLNNTATAAPFATDGLGRLAPTSAATPSATSTVLSSSANPSQAGQPVTLTATVTSSGVTPTGSVTFRDGGAVLATSALDASGRAAFTTSGLAAGTHSITAEYGGDARSAASASPALSQTVNPAPTAAATSTSLASSLNPAAAGQAVTLTAAVTPSGGSGIPTGSITFKDGSTVLGVVALDSAGTARLTKAFTAGSHALTAAYGGDANFQASVSPVLTQQVNSTSSAPANDFFANRIVLSGSSVTSGGTNVKATRESGEPRHAGNAGGRSVWWTWTAPASGTVTIDTAGSNFDTLLAVYTGTSVSALTPVASNDDAGGGTVSSRVTFAATAGRQYQIAVDGYGGASGSIALRLNLPATTAAASTSLFSSRTIQPLDPIRTTVLA